MGRYDKIKVYSSGSWRTPNQIRVYNNGWQDLGTATSYSTKKLQVRSGSAFYRATLNRKDQVVVTDRYAEGQFTLLPANGYCRCSKSSSAGNYDWYFRATVEKTTANQQYLFYCGTGTPSSPGANYVRVTWLADGKIQVDSSFNSTVRSFSSSNSVGANTSVYLNVYSNKGSYSTTIVFNDVTTTSSTLANSFRYANAKTYVGDTNTRIRGTLSAAGVDGSGGTHSCSFNAATASGTDGTQYNGVVHRETTRTDVYYE